MSRERLAPTGGDSSQHAALRADFVPEGLLFGRFPWVRGFAMTYPSVPGMSKPAVVESEVRRCLVVTASRPKPEVPAHAYRTVYLGELCMFLRTDWRPAQ